MKINNTSLIILAVLIIFILFLVGNCTISCSQKSGFNFNNSEYQYSNPNVGIEYDYYKCINDECNGNTYDYLCLEKCHLKSYRKGMMEPDIKDMVCWSYKNNEDAYYRCLDAVYADYKYP